MPRFQFARTVSLCLSLLGAIINFACAVQLLSAWRALKWEPESEWEGSEATWRGDSFKLVWGLLSAYFAIAATLCVVGFVGIIRSIPSFVRFYRDYSIADFAFCTFFTIVGTYAAFRTSARTIICEELSRQPDLMRELAEMGLNLENCELWFERAVLSFMMGTVVIIVIRLHFLIALSSYYSYLSRHQAAGLPTHLLWRSQASDDSVQQQHIYLLPRPSSSRITGAAKSSTEDILVYAPVPLSSISPLEAQNLRSSATEAWITRTEPSSSQSVRSHRHGHRHHGSSSSSSGDGSSGRISLPVAPEEGLLPTPPAYEPRPSSLKV